MGVRWTPQREQKAVAKHFKITARGKVPAPRRTQPSSASKQEFPTPALLEHKRRRYSNQQTFILFSKICHSATKLRGVAVVPGDWKRRRSSRITRQTTEIVVSRLLPIQTHRSR